MKWNERWSVCEKSYEAEKGLIRLWKIHASVREHTKFKTAPMPLYTYKNTHVKYI